MNNEQNQHLEEDGIQPPREQKPVNDNTIDNSNKSANDTDYDSDMERYDQATAASEASFTLEPEKGLTPDPDTLNKETEREGNNVKK